MEAVDDNCKIIASVNGVRKTQSVTIFIWLLNIVSSVG